jgi:hypothetical protein
MHCSHLPPSSRSLIPFAKKLPIPARHSVMHIKANAVTLPEGVSYSGMKKDLYKF